jgi:hypothetical protein
VEQLLGLLHRVKTFLQQVACLLNPRALAELGKLLVKSVRFVRILTCQL